MKAFIITVISLFYLSSIKGQPITITELITILNSPEDKAVKLLKEKGFQFDEIHTGITGEKVKIYRKSDITESIFIGPSWVPEVGRYTDGISYMTNNKGYITSLTESATNFGFIFSSKSPNENGIASYYMSSDFTLQVVMNYGKDEPSIFSIRRRTNNK
jgi:hypothetical protein